jgi:aspartate kinase
VADVARIQAVAAKVAAAREEGRAVVVVVSAMGDTTDELLALARQVSESPARRELDMLLSAGERISMALLSMALNARGIPAVSFTGSQSGIVTSDSHTNARIVEVRPFRVQDELDRGRVVIVAGYQGVSYKKEVTTLGRGGSDTTAVALAAALDADCEIYSDVDGVKSADPRVVPQARHLAELGYEEMQELAEAGARVLNAQAVEFAKEKGIAIWARATASPQAELRAGDPTSDGTVVRRHAPRMPGTVAGVASERDILVLQARGDATRLVALLDGCAVSGKQLHVAALGGAADGTTLVISRENLHNEDRLRRDLATAFGDDARLVDGLGAVSVVGAGINATYEHVRKGSACLNDRGIATFGLATSSFRATWLVKREQIDDAARALHATFIEGNRSAAEHAG